MGGAHQRLTYLLASQIQSISIALVIETKLLYFISQVHALVQMVSLSRFNRR